MKVHGSIVLWKVEGLLLIRKVRYMRVCGSVAGVREEELFGSRMELFVSANSTLDITSFRFVLLF